jgi:hypothetical protein
MPRQLKARALGAALIVGLVALVATSAASAETGPPKINKTVFGEMYPCSNGTCTMGPGDTGMPFGAILIGEGGPEQTLETNSYMMSVVSGSLPPGLRLALPDTEWQIMGTPTRAGTYTFTIQIADIAGGPDSFEKFSITIGAGSSDRLVIASAGFSSKFGLEVLGFDVNVGATYTVYSGASGAEIGTLKQENSGDGEPFDGSGPLFSKFGSFSETITVKDSLGSSVTVPVTRVKPK